MTRIVRTNEQGADRETQDASNQDASNRDASNRDASNRTGETAPTGAASPGRTAGRAVRRPLEPGRDEYFVGLSRQIAALTGMTADTTLAVGVTGAARQEGVTTIAINLAAAAARDLQRPVLLADANFENPLGASACGARSGPGLADLLIDEDWTLEDCLQQGDAPQLQVLGPGTSEACEGLTVRSDVLRRLLRRMNGAFGMIVFDLPVANELTACLPIARELDGVVFVVEAERSRRQAVARAKRQLMQCGAEMLGIVFNKRRQHVPNWLYQRL